MIYFDNSASTPLIPAVKEIKMRSGFLAKRAIRYEKTGLDSRLLSALQKLPYDDSGAVLDICVSGNAGEGYTLCINENDISIKAEGPAGAFYAIQTLRQIFKHEEIPCLDIADKPDFEHRGFYHDVTRGKIPTVETIKKLIDQMAYYKLNSLQLYVEHTFEFEEYKQLNDTTGYLTKEEICRIGEYCRENFIDFIPSLSTFGHMYEILELPQYKHLAVLSDWDPHTEFGTLYLVKIGEQGVEEVTLISEKISSKEPMRMNAYFSGSNYLVYRANGAERDTYVQIGDQS